MSRALDFLRRRRALLLAGYLASWAGAFVLTHLPGERLPDVGPRDKLLHSVGYLGLCLALSAALTGFRVGRRARLRVVVLGLLLYGAVDEATQPYFGRTADLRDLAFDALGVAVGVALWEALLGRKSSVAGDHFPGLSS